MSLLLTCDQGGWRTPSRLRSLLQGTPIETAQVPSAIGASSALKRHDTDRAAFVAARRLATMTGAKLIANESRADLIDVGRSLHHRGLLTLAVRRLPQTTRAAIIDEIYQPYRQQVTAGLESLIRQHGYVVHLSVRTYAAKTKDGKWRRGDIGLLYDPASQDELDWSLDLIDELYDRQMNLKVRRNYPTRGTNDSLAKAIRARLSGQSYIGVELTLNRAWVSRNLPRCQAMLEDLADAIVAVSEVDSMSQPVGHGDRAA